MSIISRRIPSPLAGAESCGTNQQWDPNYVFNGIKGQCTPRGSAMAPAPTPGFFDSLMSAFKPSTPAPMMPAIMPAAPAASGMSQTTMIAIGLGAVGLLAVVLLSRK
jgi:hypothetical protein